MSSDIEQLRIPVTEIEAAEVASLGSPVREVIGRLVFERDLLRQRTDDAERRLAEVTAERDRAQHFAGRIAVIANEHGWNGVENSKDVAVFIDSELNELAALKAAIAAAPVAKAWLDADGRIASVQFVQRDGHPFLNPNPIRVRLVPDPETEEVSDADR